MAVEHTWRLALPGQRCQERRCYDDAVWALVIEGAHSGEELLCEECAAQTARHEGLDVPVAQGVSP